MPNDVTDWTPERIQMLLDMDGAGLSFAEQGERLGGVSRASVARQRKRLGIRARAARIPKSPRQTPAPRAPKSSATPPSPRAPTEAQIEIVRYAQAGYFTSEQIAVLLDVPLPHVRLTRMIHGRATVQQLGDLAIAEALARFGIVLRERPPSAPAVRAPVVALPRAAVPRLEGPLRAATCQYPVQDGDPIRPWLFCDAPTERGSYCAEHYARCYVRVRERHEGAPAGSWTRPGGFSFGGPSA